MKALCGRCHHGCLHLTEEDTGLKNYSKPVFICCNKMIEWILFFALLFMNDIESFKANFVLIFARKKRIMSSVLQ